MLPLHGFKSKLNILDWSALGFRVFLKEVPPRSPSILLIFVPLLLPFSMHFGKLLPSSFSICVHGA
jgi:hypothetical protein